MVLAVSSGQPERLSQSPKSFSMFSMAAATLISRHQFQVWARECAADHCARLHASSKEKEETAPKIDPRSTLHSSDGFRFHGATRASQIRKCF